jgi:L-ascorbate metabolism protein UlaG (beta-lactamase superfamily)
VLRITYLGKTSFKLESEEMSVLLNPGIWREEAVTPPDTETKVIIATNEATDALGNATEVATHSKAWILGNEATIERVKEQGGKPWLLHVLTSEEPYEIPGLRVIPYSLKRDDPETGEPMENLGLYLELGKMRVAYLGDSKVRGPFGQFEVDIVIVPIGGDGVFPVKDAVGLCIDAKPKLGIPMRWVSNDQPKKFAKYLDQFAQGVSPLVMEEDQTVETHWAAGNEFRYELS